MEQEALTKMLEEMDMNRKLYIGFKGKNNASCILAKSISADSYLLTNSFDGLKRDIELLNDYYDYIIVFGIDKKLKDTVRIEKVAEKECRVFSVLDLKNISVRLNSVGILNNISDTPTHYLCNEAYWYLLQKFKGKAVLIHVPSIKNLNEVFIEKLKLALG